MGQALAVFGPVLRNGELRRIARVTGFQSAEAVSLADDSGHACIEAVHEQQPGRSCAA